MKNPMIEGRRVWPPLEPLPEFEDEEADDWATPEIDDDDDGDIAAVTPPPETPSAITR